MSDHESSGTGKKLIENAFFYLAKLNLALHRPVKVVVVGSVGKTSTKISLAKLLATEYEVSYMDDSYNDGIGLYLSVFELKVPTNSSVASWLLLFLRAMWRTITRHAAIIVLEYGISKPGDMDQMLKLAKPDVAVLTAVTPEHMEYLKTIDIVGEEEVKAVRAAREMAIINAEDVDRKYLEDINIPLSFYGDGGSADASFKINNLSTSGAEVDFTVDGRSLNDQNIKIVSDALIRQLTGAILTARRLGVSLASIKEELPKLRPVPGRMQLFEGKNESVILDDTANFSPVAGIVALDVLKKLPVKRRIAILGNMHELGDYADEGYEDVGKSFKGIDVFVLVGNLSREHFGKIAKKQGYIKNKTLFDFDNSIEAGEFVASEILKKGDGVLVKGPFGGFYLEEATKRLLADKGDQQLLTRQSDFWIRKKRAHFGDLFDA